MDTIVDNVCRLNDPVIRFTLIRKTKVKLLELINIVVSQWEVNMKKEIYLVKY